MSDLRPESVSAFSNFYTENQSFLEYTEKFGNEFERAVARFIVTVATEGVVNDV